MFLGLRYVARTPFGLALQGLRDEPNRMRALGFNVTRHRILAFGLAAFVAAIAGVLSVWYNRRISPGSINLAQTIDVLIIAVIGGLYRLEGAWVGALTYALLDNYSREWTPRVGDVLGPERFNTILGFVFLVIVLLSPGGLVGLWERGRELLGTRRRGPPRDPWRPRTRPTDLGGRRARQTSRRRGCSESQDIAGADRRLAGPGPRDGLWRRRRRRRRWQRRVERPVGGGGTIKVGFLSDCEGDFGSFFEPTASGFNQALIDKAGAKPASKKPSEGVTGATVGGKKIEIVGYGCADDTADKAIEETRRLMEQEDADILVGPLSGDEGIAVANYAKEHPDKTFINGIAGAQDSTLKVGRRTSTATTRTARSGPGLGDYAYNDLGWKTAAIIGDDYSFPYTSLAGFVAEYCAIGGKVTKRIWAPLGEKDYSSYISQIPDDVDGLRRHRRIGPDQLRQAVPPAEGRLDTKKMMGNVFWDDPLVLKEVGNSLIGGTTAAMTAGDSTDPEVTAYLKRLEDSYGKEIAGLGPSVFTYGYYTAGQALVKALEESGGDVSDQKALRTRWPLRRCRATRRLTATSSWTTTTRRSATSS